MKDFAAIDPTLLYTRDAATDPRLSDLSTSPEPSTIIAGYPDDEGIKNNGGRTGAMLGPNRIRHYLYRTTPHLFLTTKPSFQDIGNLITDGSSLPLRHEKVESAVYKNLTSGRRWLSLGGGHDYAYPDVMAYVRYCHEVSAKPLVINFDAHLDVRPLETTINSGTAFWRLLEKNRNIDFLEIGIQSQCNSRQHLKWALERGTQVLSLQEIRESGLSALEKTIAFLTPFTLKSRPTLISFDIDVMSAAYAPGCSQSWGSGLTAEEAVSILQVLFRRMDVRLFGIYEVSPPLDVGDITSKMAAELANLFLCSEEAK